MATDADAQRVLGGSPKRPGYIPPGFREQGLFLVSSGRGEEYLQVRYADGMRLLIVAQRREPAETGGRRSGKGQAGARIIELRGWPVARIVVGGIRATVLGPLPEDELLKVAGSLR